MSKLKEYRLRAEEIETIHLALTNQKTQNEESIKFLEGLNNEKRDEQVIKRFHEEQERIDKLLAYFTDVIEINKQSQI